MSGQNNLLYNGMLGNKPNVPQGLVIYITVDNVYVDTCPSSPGELLPVSNVPFNAKDALPG